MTSTSSRAVADASGEIASFATEVASIIARNGESRSFAQATDQWMRESISHRYSYCFSWLGRPIIQYPQDMVAMQELIWKVRPDLVIETGIAHGGSLILSASMLAMLDMCDAIAEGRSMDPSKSKRLVLGVDIDIRAHNRAAIEAHPMSSRIRMIQGSSIAEDVVRQVHATAEGFRRVMVCLDSNHTHQHVLAELQAYAPLVSPGSYCVVFDTVVEHLPAETFRDRPWGPGNSPKSAVHEFLRMHPDFAVCETTEGKLLVTAAPGGYLQRAPD
jgi:cephalosporin hydroxylase